jgi:hypothetical protein
MVFISVIIKSFIILPLRVIWDLIQWFFKVFLPFIGTILGAYPLNVIFLISIFIMFLMFIFPDWVSWMLVLVWEINRNFFINIWLVAINAIVQLFYSWFATGWNNFIDFWSLVFEMVWAGLCGGAPPFSQIVDCTGFGNFLIIIEIILGYFIEYWTILMGTFVLAFQLLNTILGPISDPLMSNKVFCANQACSDWGGKIRIDPDTGSLIKNPGPFGLNLKSMLNEQDVRFAQVFAYMIVGFIKWLFLDVIPLLFQVLAFSTDVFRLVLFYFQELVLEIVEAFARVFGAVVYIIQRAFNYISLQPDGVIVFDTEFWNMNISEFKHGTQDEIINAYIGEYMINITNLMLYQIRDKGIGNIDVTNKLINLYGYIYVALQIIMELPLSFVLLIDKFWCVFIHLFQCLDLTITCRALFQPPLECFALQKIATNDYLQSKTPDPWYYNYGEPLVLELYLYSYCLGAGCSQNGTCPDGAPDICQSGAQFKCIDYINGISYEFREYDFQCVDGTFGGVDPTTGPYREPGPLCILRHVPTATGCTINQNEDPPITVYLGNYGSHEILEFRETGCNLTDVPLTPNGCRYCGEYWKISDSSGLLFPDKNKWWNVYNLDIIVIAIDLLNVLITEDLWAGLYELGVFFMFECLDFSDSFFGDCPCNTCDTTDFPLLEFADLKFFEYFTFLKYPCNPVIECCEKSPYYSLLFVMTDILNTFDLFGVLDLPTEDKFP